MTSEGYRTLLYRIVPYRTVSDYEILRFWSKSYKVSIYLYVSIFLKCIDTLIELLKYHDIKYRYVSILFGTRRIMIYIDVSPTESWYVSMCLPRIMISIDVPPPNRDMYRCAPPESWYVSMRPPPRITIHIDVPPPRIMIHIDTRNIMIYHDISKYRYIQSIDKYP